ncbi:asparaginase [Neobacillus jeddahensis]|uniref:asparaginase n=1 Tax=Neobacillus jeddahensis TaxID=1461580 RepID=UPI00058D8A21|nr:asparaginase [Neobacillus jeddahensis]
MEEAIKVYRGKYLESTHTMHVAVVNTKGELLYSYGNPDRPTFPRSSMKPFQAVPVLETGAARAFHFADADISLICASHSGESRHRERVLKIIDGIHLEENHLQCGTHIPRDAESYKALIRNGGELTPVYSNCSGKHSGMLTAVVHMNEDVNSYRELSHPHQQRILQAIEDICEYPKKNIEIGVDGCGVPVHRLPLRYTGLGYARLANPFMKQDEHSQTLNQICHAMMKHPEMVGGENRFDTDVMRAFKGKIVSKAGAEGVQCLGVVGEDLGIVVKIEDGNARAVSAVALEVLKQLRIGDEAIYKELDHYVNTPVLNTRNDQIGRITVQFELVKH